MQFIHRYHGFSLIEVLIALALMSGALLGMISLQNFALSQVHSAYLQSVAMSQASSLLERFRANDESDAARDQEFNRWLQEIPYFLPQGSGEYRCSLKISPCEIQVIWQAHGSQTFSLSTLI